MNTQAHIEILKRTVPALAWYPTLGAQSAAFLRRKELEGQVSAAELETVLYESQVILGRSIAPVDPGKVRQNTGLVVGYVQSGKTMSFTAVTALARDNGFGLVIILAGTQTNLKEQSEDRLARDLGLEDEHVARAWQHFSNPTLKQKPDIQRSLNLWADSAAPSRLRRAVLVTVLKNVTRLSNLVEMLKGLQLASVPTLVIDDEADQASLNTKVRRGGRSPTYANVLEIKDRLPWHTVLQYTATPQANLLISINDLLSPDFCEPIAAGASYVGGQEYFAHRSPYIEIIPPADQLLSQRAGSTPPQSLIRALKLFLLGIAYEANKGQTDLRSMMVHPSQPTDPHGQFSKWIGRSLDSWRRYFTSKAGLSLLLQDFQETHASLRSTVPDLPDLNALLEHLRYLLDGIKVAEINRSGREDEEFNWRRADYWILIGGQKLDRGFTVKGLTVTYMPRSLGTGNADTLQQRARFFGYKKQYLGLCRVFVTNDVRSAFERYVLHERDMRAELEAMRGKPLKEWYRKFFLPDRLHPTRSNVLSVQFDRLTLGPGRWVKPEALYENASLQQANGDLLRSLRDKWQSAFGSENAGKHERYRDRRKDSSPNVLIDNVPLRTVMEDFFLQFRVADQKEADQRTALMKVIAHRLEKHPDQKASVFLVADLQPGRRSRGKGFELFQGYVPKGASPQSRTYVGDAQLFDSNKFTLHLRMLRVAVPKIGDVDAAWYAARLPDGWDTYQVLFRDKEGKQ